MSVQTHYFHNILTQYFAWEFQRVLCRIFSQDILHLHKILQTIFKLLFFHQKWKWFASKSLVMALDNVLRLDIFLEIFVHMTCRCIFSTSTFETLFLARISLAMVVGLVSLVRVVGLTLYEIFQISLVGRERGRLQLSFMWRQLLARLVPPPPTVSGCHAPALKTPKTPKIFSQIFNFHFCPQITRLNSSFITFIFSLNTPSPQMWHSHFSASKYFAQTVSNSSQHSICFHP